MDDEITEKEVWEQFLKEVLETKREVLETKHKVLETKHKVLETKHEVRETRRAAMKFRLEIVDTRRDLSRRLDRIAALANQNRVDLRVVEDRIAKLESKPVQ